MTTTQSNGEFLAIVGIAGLFALVLYLLLSIRDAEKVHPYKRWQEYQDALPSGIPAPPDDDKYAFYHEATTEPGVQITGPITMVDPVTAIDRGIDT